MLETHHAELLCKGYWQWREKETKKHIYVALSLTVSAFPAASNCHWSEIKGTWQLTTCLDFAEFLCTSYISSIVILPLNVHLTQCPDIPVQQFSSVSLVFAGMNWTPSLHVPPSICRTNIAPSLLLSVLFKQGMERRSVLGSWGILISR